MFDPITDTINTFIGIIVLSISAISIVYHLIHPHPIKRLLPEVPNRMSKEETEEQCKHCYLYYDCLELSCCYEPNCCDCEPFEDYNP